MRSRASGKSWKMPAARAVVPARHLFPALSTPLAGPRAEGDRVFALGWLHWLAGDVIAAEPLLAVAAERLPPATPEGVQAAYWLARTCLAEHPAEALAAFEKVLRSAQGSPLATCWFVDLLGAAAEAIAERSGGPYA